ncbi:MAG: TolB family protein, partial [Vicinamibacterales bacterium]
MRYIVSTLLVGAGLAGGVWVSAQQPASGAKPLPALASEKRFTNLRQLTFGGENAEAYFAADGKRLVFQATRDGLRCDQMYTINVDGTDMRRLSNGEGRTTCGY